MPRFDKLLVLDLDETLIHATATPQSVGRAGDHTVGPYAVYRRPHLDDFLRTVLEWFDVGVWTSSSPLYATQVVGWLGLHDELRFMWAGDRCTRWLDPNTLERVKLKPLQKVVRSMKVPKTKVLFVDDSPEKIQRSYGNYIRIKPYEGALEDDELPALLRYLETLGPIPNVRTIEKRGWRTQIG